MSTSTYSTYSKYSRQSTKTEGKSYGYGAQKKEQQNQEQNFDENLFQENERKHKQVMLENKRRRQEKERKRKEEEEQKKIKEQKILEDRKKNKQDSYMKYLRNQQSNNILQQFKSENKTKNKENQGHDKLACPSIHSNPNQKFQNLPKQSQPVTSQNSFKKQQTQNQNYTTKYSDNENNLKGLDLEISQANLNKLKKNKIVQDFENHYVKENPTENENMQQSKLIESLDLSRSSAMWNMPKNYLENDKKKSKFSKDQNQQQQQKNQEKYEPKIYKLPDNDKKSEINVMNNTSSKFNKKIAQHIQKAQNFQQQLKNQDVESNEIEEMIGYGGNQALLQDSFDSDEERRKRYPDLNQETSDVKQTKNKDLNNQKFDFSKKKEKKELIRIDSNQQSQKLTEKILSEHNQNDPSFQENWLKNQEKKADDLFSEISARPSMMSAQSKKRQPNHQIQQQKPKNETSYNPRGNSYSKNNNKVPPQPKKEIEQKSQVSSKLSAYVKPNFKNSQKVRDSSQEIRNFKKQQKRELSNSKQNQQQYGNLNSNSKKNSIPNNIDDLQSVQSSTVSKFKKKLQNSIEQSNIQSTQPRKKQQWNKPPSIAGNNQQQRRNLSPGTTCTREDDLDVDEFLKDDLTNLNKEEQLLQQEIIEIHKKNSEKVREIECKNQIQINYKTSKQLLNSKKNINEQENMRQSEINKQYDEEMLEQSLMNLDELLAKKGQKPKSNTMIPNYNNNNNLNTQMPQMPMINKTITSIDQFNMNNQSLQQPVLNNNNNNNFALLQQQQQQQLQMQSLPQQQNQFNSLQQQQQSINQLNTFQPNNMNIIQQMNMGANLPNQPGMPFPNLQQIPLNSQQIPFQQFQQQNLGKAQQIQQEPITYNKADYEFNSDDEEENQNKQQNNNNNGNKIQTLNEFQQQQQKQTQNQQKNNDKSLPLTANILNQLPSQSQFSLKDFEDNKYGDVDLKSVQGSTYFINNVDTEQRQQSQQGQRINTKNQQQHQNQSNAQNMTSASSFSQQGGVGGKFGRKMQQYKDNQQQKSKLMQEFGNTSEISRITHNTQSMKSSKLKPSEYRQMQKQVEQEQKQKQSNITHNSINQTSVSQQSNYASKFQQKKDIQNHKKPILEEEEDQFSVIQREAEINSDDENDQPQQIKIVKNNKLAALLMDD